MASSTEIINSVYDSSTQTLKTTASTTGSSTALGQQQTTITASTAETTVVTAGGSGVYNHLYGLILANSSGSATLVTVKDATSGTTRMVFYVPAGDTRGFMVTTAGAHRQAVANNNWTVTCGTSVSSLYVTALFTKSTT